MLITNLTLNGRTGTEIVTRNVALGLRRAGHRPSVYSPELGGPIVEELRGASIPVTDDIAMVDGPLDIIHGHHTPTTATAVVRFPDTPAIFMGHDFAAWHDTPPLFPSLRRYVAISEAIADRMTRQEGVPSNKVTILLGAVDLARCPSADDLPVKPTRALVFTKGRGYLLAIETACEKRGIAVEAIGRVVDRLVDDPETAIVRNHLVFASGLSALEAMACGRGVVVCDQRGLAGLVTSERFDRYRAANFGLRTLSRPVTAEAIGAEIDLFNRDEALSVAARVRAVAGLDQWIKSLSEIYEEVLDEPRDWTEHATLRRTATAQYLQNWQPRKLPWRWLAEREDLLRINEQFAHELDDARTGVSAIAVGTKLSFESGSPTIKSSILLGFAKPADHGAWSIGDKAAVVFRLAVPPPCDLEAAVEFVPLLTEDHASLDVSVFINGFPIADWELRFDPKARSRVHSVGIPASLLGPMQTVWLGFSFNEPRSPFELGISNDRRRLALRLGSITVKESPVAPGASSPSASVGHA